MTVPFRLTKRGIRAAPADAFLLPTDSFARLADACVNMSGVALPTVHPVRDGFLLVPAESTARPLPGSVRLRRLAGDLFLPVDANLSPALMPDEMASLTRERGIIVLPGGEVLAFAPNKPLAIQQWLAPARVRRDAWRPFPSRPTRPDQLGVIERPATPTRVIELLAAGQPEGTEPLPGAGDRASTNQPIPEDARPPASPLFRRVRGTAAMGFGSFLAWLGRHLNLPGLARAGGNLIRRALDQVPRLSESLLGAQEAALREVLRQLQSGNVEEALRRAPVAVPDPDRPGRVGMSADLGTRDPRYSLRDLVGSSNSPGTVWLGGGNVWAELANEYRRLAAEAAARGDARRAAYLYGVLLRDLRAAANALMAGSLFRDAAILFRDRLRDLPSAATAFERAGDYDEAVRLYDRLGRYEQAAELLLRLGDEARALEYFTRAAYGLAAQNRWLAAGDLLRSPAGDWLGATRFYRAGWASESAETVLCGERLCDELITDEAWPALAELLAEAGTRFAPPRAADAGRFFNHVLRVGSGLLPDELADDLADRARLLFADHLRSGARAPGRAATLLTELFGQQQTWAGPVVRDATFAARAVPPRPNLGYDSPVHLAPGTVNAVVVVRDTRDLVVATTEAVVCWRAGEGTVVPVCPVASGSFAGLSVDPRGDIVYGLRLTEDGVEVLCFAASRTGAFEPRGIRQWVGEDSDVRWYLQPTALFHQGDYQVLVCGSTGRIGLRGLYLLHRSPAPFSAEGSQTHLLVWDGGHTAWEWADRTVRCREAAPPGKTRCEFLPRWSPALPSRSTLLMAGVDWLAPAPWVLEVAGTDGEGVVHWSEFDGRDPRSPRSRSASLPHPDQFLAACLLGSALLAAATGGNEIHWLQVSGTTLKPWAGPTRIHLPARVVALVSRPLSNDVVAVLQDGSAVRVRKP